MVICLERGASLHMAQRIPLPLTVSCFSKIQIGFTFLVPAHPGSPGQRAVKRVYVCMYAEATSQPWSFLHNGAPKAGKALMTYRNAHKKGHLAETIVLCCGRNYLEQDASL